MGGGAPTTTETCFYVYASAGANWPAQLVWTGTDKTAFGAAIDSFGSPPWSIVDFGSYPCGTPVPAPTQGPTPAPTPTPNPPGDGGGEPPSNGNPPTGGGGGGPIIIPPPAGNPGEGDALQQCCQASVTLLTTIAAELAAWEAKQGGGGTSSQCCANVVAAIGVVATQISAIPIAIRLAAQSGAGGGSAPVDLSGVIAALQALGAALAAYPAVWTAIGGAIATQLGGIADAIATQQGTDVSGIVQKLGEIFTTIDTPVAMYQALADAGYLDPSYLQYFGQGATAPAAVYKSVVADWDAIRARVKHWLGIDIGPPGAAPTSPAAGPPTLTSELKSTLSASDSLILPILQPLLNTVIAQLTPPGVPAIGASTVNPTVPVASAASVALTAGVGAWLLSYLGIDGGQPLAEIAQLIAGAIGFEELRQVQIGPLVRRGIGKIADMQAAAAFQQELPGAGALFALVARGLLASTRATQLVPFTGLPAELVPAEQAAAYTGLNARMLLRLIESPQFSNSDLTDELTFDGMRQVSQQRLLAAAPYLATASQRNSYISALESAYAAGLYADNDFQSAVTNAQTILDLPTLTLLSAKVKKLVAETKAIETEYATLYKAGLLDDATFRSNLAAIGLQPDMVDTVAARAEAQANATLQKKTISAAAALARATAAKERTAAMKSFATGSINAAVLAAELVATGLTATQAAAWVSLAQMQLAGSLRWVYGLQLQPQPAKLLTDRVSALSTQLEHAQITDAAFDQALAALGIPPLYINALHAKAAASKASAPLATLIPVSTS
jgi:hypothetical protein